MKSVQTDTDYLFDSFLAHWVAVAFFAFGVLANIHSMIVAESFAATCMWGVFVVICAWCVASHTCHSITAWRIYRAMRKGQ